MLTFYLAIAVVAVPLGAGIAFVSRVQQRHFGNIFGLTAGAVARHRLGNDDAPLHRGRLRHNPCDVGRVSLNRSGGIPHNASA